MAIPKYLFSAVSECALENGLLSRCMVFEAGERGTAGNPHFKPFPDELITATELSRGVYQYTMVSQS